MTELSLRPDNPVVGATIRTRARTCTSPASRSTPTTW